MSVQTEIDRIISAVEAAHLKVAEKGGTTARPFLVGNLESAIDSIPVVKDPVLQQKTVTPTTAKQTVTPDSGYDGLSQVDVNAMPTATQATPSISVSTGGLITVSATQSAGYVFAGTKSATKQLNTQAAKTVTPSTSSQTAVASGVYTTGAVAVAGDANLVPGNIKSGVSIFGVAGSYEGSGGGGGSVETCTVEILADTPMSSDTMLSYILPDGEVEQEVVSQTDWMMGFSLTVKANTPIASNKILGISIITGGAIVINQFCYHITGDATITIG